MNHSQNDVSKKLYIFVFSFIRLEYVIWNMLNNLLLVSYDLSYIVEIPCFNNPWVFKVLCVLVLPSMWMCTIIFLMKNEGMVLDPKVKHVVYEVQVHFSTMKNGLVVINYLSLKT